jgi:hypothetical protein
MALLDNQLLFALIISPIFLAIFVSRIPNFDVSSVRQITSAFLMIWLAFLLKCGHFILSNKQPLFLNFNYSFWIDNNAPDLFLGKVQFILLLALWFSLFIVFFLNKHITENNGLSFSIMTLLLLALVTLTILSSTLTLSIISANLSFCLFLFLLARHGGSEKGSAVLISSLFFFTVDLFSLAVLFLPRTVWLSFGSYLYWIALSPALARLLIPFFAPFSRTMFKNSSVDIIILYIAFIIPTGASLLFSIKNTLFVYLATAISNPIVNVLVFASSLYAAFWIIVEKDCRQIGLSLLIFYDAIFVNFVFKSQTDGSSGLAITTLFCAIICASFTLYVGQLLFEEQRLELSNSTINHLWLASLALWIPLPGLGIGTVLWLDISLYSSTLLSPVFTIFFWLTTFLLLITALIQNYFRHINPQKTGRSISGLLPRTLGNFKNAWATFATVLFLCLASLTYFFNTGA